MEWLTRRNVFTALGLLISGLGAAHEKPARLMALAERMRGAHERKSVLMIGKWLAEHNAPAVSIADIDSAKSATATDIRTSFARDALVRVDGLLLPVGFCRYCRTTYENEIRSKPRDQISPA